jgi:hypothetical protein
MPGCRRFTKRREDNRRQSRGSWKPAGYRFRAPGCRVPVRGRLAPRIGFGSLPRRNVDNRLGKLVGVAGAFGVSVSHDIPALGL